MIKLHLITDGGDIENGDYNITLIHSDTPLNLNSMVSDIFLINDCIGNELDLSLVDTDGVTEVILEESGEFENGFWQPFYKIKSVQILTSEPDIDDIVELSIASTVRDFKSKMIGISNQDSFIDRLAGDYRC